MPIKVIIFKIYFKINLASDITKLLKFLTNTVILLNYKKKVILNYMLIIGSLIF